MKTQVKPFDYDRNSEKYDENFKITTFEGTLRIIYP